MTTSINANNNHTTNENVDYASLSRRLRRTKRRLLFQHLENDKKGPSNTHRRDANDGLLSAKTTESKSSREASRSIPTIHVARLLREASNLHATVTTRARK